MGAEPALAIIFGNVTLISSVAIVGGLLHARRNRTLEHAERMKALELGRPWPMNGVVKASHTSSDQEWSPERMGHTLAVNVPLSALGIALGAQFLFHGASPVLWMAAGAVGVAGIASGTVLTLRQMAAREYAQAQATAYAPKPAMDPDAYDVAGRRG
jgi:hypothetical protein